MTHSTIYRLNTPLQVVTAKIAISRNPVLIRKKATKTATKNYENMSLNLSVCFDESNKNGNKKEQSNEK